ncbi:ATP-dependent DNA helicase [Tessaracoccus lapidicaptus]|uniref:ATP-dependent DNA helicase n=1 Tax=Tessaracoccus lapidicaptus TaxID=1427523 RepID=UPI00333F8584
MNFRVLPPRRAVAPVLTLEQRAALGGDGVRVVLGGPGTGKSTVAAAAAAERVRGGAELERIIVVSHTRPAAQQLRRDITRRIDRAQTGAMVTTVHGLSLGLLRRFLPHEDEGWRLLRAPEQEQRIRELLDGQPVEAWPEAVRPALRTRAFARQLREVLARVRQLSLDPEALESMAREGGDELFAAVARFLESYLTVGDFSGTLDYAELVYRTRLLLTDSAVTDAVRASFDAVIVDDAHELDPAQVGLVTDLARAGLPLLALGDPRQRIGGYRGASATALTDLGGLPGARTLVLAAGHRARTEVAAALGALQPRIGGPVDLPPPLPAGPGGRVAARVFDDATAELAHVAAEIRSAVTVDGLDWGDLVVVTRSGRSQLSGIAAELIRQGVPVEVSGDEIAVAEQPAAATLLLALDVAARGGAPAADEARLLLSSPLAGLDGVAQRALGRSLVARHRALGTSAVLTARCLADADLLTGIDTPEASAARRLGRLLAEAASLLEGGGEVQEALWLLWDRSPWPARLRERALRGSRRADADLDAVVELFDLAARSGDMRGQAGAVTFIAEVAGQEIPADTGRESSVTGRGVRVVTAHRTRGLQWERVWILGVQEGAWPRLTRAGLLLDPDRIGPEALAPPGQASQLAAERRLFHVACSRAVSELRVSAVQGIEGEGGRPSRFLDELGVAVERVYGRPRDLLSTASLVGDLRRTLADETAGPGLRRAAALRLARLSQVEAPDGAPGFPGAAPDGWWGLHPPSPGVSPDDGPVRITGSSLEMLLECPRRWFLSRRAKADSGRQSRASVGDVVHLLARHAAVDGLDAAGMRAKLAEVWTRIPFEAEWLSTSERSEIEAAIDRFARYHEHSRDTLLAVEHPFRVSLTVAGQEVQLDGTVDRLERLPDGRLRIVDLKTGRRLLKEADVVDHAQLGVYQLAASLGAFEDVAPGARAVAPPALLFLRGGEALPLEVAQPSIDDSPRLPAEDPGDGPTWVHDRIRSAVEIVRGGRYDATECASCRYCPFAASCPALGRSGVAL